MSWGARNSEEQGSKDVAWSLLGFMQVPNGYGTAFDRAMIYSSVKEGVAVVDCTE